MDGGDKSALASELAQVLAMVRELEARMDQDPLPATARELCAELASSVDRSIRIARSCCVDSPASRAGSPRSDGGNAGAAQSKRRQVDRSCCIRVLLVTNMRVASRA
jgi:hypothetical protein